MRQRFVRRLTSEERTGLEALHRQGRTHDERRRAQFILFSAAGHDLRHSAQLVGMSRKTADRTLGNSVAQRSLPDELAKARILRSYLVAQMTGLPRRP